VKVRRTMFKIRDFLSARPEIYHRPLLPMVMALASGILIGGLAPGCLYQAAMIGCVALASVTLSWYRHRRTAWPPLILAGVLGYGLISPWLPSKLPENHISQFTDSHRWRIEGIVTQRLPAHYERVRLNMKVTQLSGHHKSYDVNGQIRVTVAGEAPALEPGTRLAFTSRIRPFHNFNNPGGFNYRRYMMFQRVYGSAFVDADRLDILETTEKLQKSFIARYRWQASLKIGQLPDPTTQAVLRALLLGDREAVGPEVRQVFNRCGVGHLLAISGLHIGIVGGLVFAFSLWWLNRFHAVLDRGWGRRGAALLATGPVLFYATLAGLSPSTQRALIMVLAFMATYFVYQEGDTLNFLALAALLMLVWNPPALFSISFQMSFAAVFWIVVGFSMAAAGSRAGLSGFRRVRHRVLTFLLVTFWATAGTLPFVMIYFQEISLIGLITNCLMVPLIGFFVLPVGLGAVFILPFYEQLAVWGIQVAGWGVSHALTALRAVASLDGVALSTFIPTPLEIVCYFILLALIAMRKAVKKFRWLLLLTLALVVADVIYWGYERYWHDDLRVTILDVGQGSSALAEFPGGATMLIDGGGHSDNRYFDVGQRIVAPFLRHQKILRVDTIVLSHPSSDHMNGLVHVVAHFNPKSVLWTGDRVLTESFKRFCQQVVRSGAEVPAFNKISRNMTVEGVEVSVLNPPTSDLHVSRHLSGAELNNRSLVLKLRMGSCGILFPGDIESHAEERLVACCRSILPCQVLVAPHHGSRTSSSMLFLQAVHPKIIVISAGWHNRFGFPHEPVLDRYRELGSFVYRTDSQGAIILRTDGHRWRTAAWLN